MRNKFRLIISSAVLVLSLALISLVLFTALDNQSSVPQGQTGQYAVATVVSTAITITQPPLPDLDATKVAMPRNPALLAANYNAAVARATSFALTPIVEVSPIIPEEGIGPKIFIPSLQYELIINNHWADYPNGRTRLVLAGYLKNDPTQGAIYIFNGQTNPVSTEKYLTQTKVGGLTITTDDRATRRLTLVATNGTTFVFDLNSRIFVGQQAPTRTPTTLSSTVVPTPQASANTAP